jgi:hypothetical protein
MKHRLLLLFVYALSTLSAQQRVDPRNTHHRLLCIVPMVGAGTDADPRRPAHAPVFVPGAAPSSSGIIAYHYQLSDDGQYALVEFVARDRSAFKDILADRGMNVRTFEKGRDKLQDIEQEFRKHKKNINLAQFGMIVP